MNEKEIISMLVSLATISAVPFFILLIFAFRGLFIIEPKRSFVLMYWGKYSRTISSPGLHWAFPIGLTWKEVSLRDNIIALPKNTVVDGLGNPIQVSCVCVFRVVNPEKAALDVANYRQYVLNQAGTVLKGVCSRYPYENRMGDHPSLKNESKEIIEALTVQMQHQVESAGLEIVLVRLNDLAYAPEIAQAMLLRQQALALVDARRTLVEGAVDTVHDGIQRLAQVEVHLSPPQRNHLISNLTLLLCAGERGEAHSTVVSRGRT
jgi:regulator of protease activity HflC (stomatin/prohibitin superfamily)